MPEPLRSQMLYGNFEAGLEDDAFQVIPTAWVQRAMDRWKDRSPKGEMDSMGVDVARGGKDNTVLAMRHGNWYDRLKRVPGSGTPDGQAVVAQAVAHRRDSCPVHVDGIGVGASPVDLLREVPVQVISVNVAESSVYTGKAGNLKFYNLRSEWWWRMREALDPTYDTGMMLPPDPELLVELCSATWTMKGSAIFVRSREDIVERIGRSPDAATAVILALMDTPNQVKVERQARERERREYNPLSGRAPMGKGREYDPLANY
jgi:hypothetical protein